MNERFLVRIDFQNDFAAPEGALTINNPDLIVRHQRFADSLQKECSAKSGIFAIRICRNISADQRGRELSFAYRIRFLGLAAGGNFER